MRIVHVEDFFHPDAGYQVNLLAKYMAKNGNEVYVITAQLDKMPDYLTKFFGKENIEGRDREYEDTTGVSIIRLPFKHYISGRVIWNKDKLFSKIDSIEPDIVYTHGNDTYTSMVLLNRCTQKKIPVITDSHMVDIASNNKFRDVFRLYYRHFVTPIITKNNITVIRTADTDYIEKYFNIPLANCPIISFGSDLLLFHPDKDARRTGRKHLDIGEDDFVFIYAGKLDEEKGGKLLASAIQDTFEGTNRKVVFLIIGNTVGEYGNDVKKIFERSKNRIIRIPTQAYVNLAQYYQLADAAIFPKQCSLSFYDVHACGLPVIFEDNSINKSRAVSNDAILFRAGSEDDLRKKIRDMLNMSESYYEVMSKNGLRLVQENYSYQIIYESYMREIDKTMKYHNSLNH